MAIPLDPGPDDRAALAFADLASAFEAGLTPQFLGVVPGSDGPAAIDALLAARDVTPLPGEREVLAAAWDAGRIGEGLRHRSQVREQRAASRRDVRRALAYPALLLALALPISGLVALATGSPVVILVLAVLLVAAVAGVWLARAMAGGSDAVLRLPGIGPLAAELAELPYLEVLHGLYASGVPLLTAHPRALAVCRLPDLHARLRQADQILQQNQPLVQALNAAQALHPETRSLLALGEQAGGLEDALHRALRRRSEATTRRAQALARILAGVAYALAVLVVIAMAFSFYSSYFGALRSLGR